MISSSTAVSLSVPGLEQPEDAPSLKDELPCSFVGKLRAAYSEGEELQDIRMAFRSRREGLATKEGAELLGCRLTARLREALHAPRHHRMTTTVYERHRSSQVTTRFRGPAMQAKNSSRLRSPWLAASQIRVPGCADMEAETEAATTDRARKKFAGVSPWSAGCSWSVNLASASSLRTNFHGLRVELCANLSHERCLTLECAPRPDDKKTFSNLRGTPTKQDLVQDSLRVLQEACKRRRDPKRN